MAPIEREQTMMAEMRMMGLDPMGDIRSLGYEYHNDRLVQVGSNRGYEFKGADEYDALAEAVSQYIPLLLEEEAGLSPLWLPLGVTPGEGCPIFASRGYEQAEKLLLIIQGSGRVLAGVWGCSLCINENLDHGTMMPYLQKASEAGYGVIVFNPNQNCVEGKKVPGSETFERHVAYVMDKVVMAHCAAAEIDILAHSHGGRALIEYLGRSSLDRSAAMLARKIRHIAFTDSYHSHGQLGQLPPLIRALLNDPQRCMNFVPHSSPVGTQVTEWLSQEYTFTAAEKGCACTSTGILDHASTNYAAMEAVFDLLDAQRIPVASGLCPAPVLQIRRSLTGVEELETSPFRVAQNQVVEQPPLEANPSFEANPGLESKLMPQKHRKGPWPQMSKIKKLLSRSSSRNNMVSPV
mmetsp:Transcript_42454/g.79727  ORF Transcript_42454/g.79727 Transcript_42454/m.79727 type:complete len:407 (-) Transcript_42454:238-1458(-)